MVLSNPVAGREQAYNDWYTSHHLSDVLKVPGFTSAQRFKAIAVSGGGEPKWRYLAIYNAETDALQEMLDEVLRRVATNEISMSEGIAAHVFAVYYEPTTPIVDNSYK